MKTDGVAQGHHKSFSCVQLALGTGVSSTKSKPITARGQFEGGMSGYSILVLCEIIFQEAALVDGVQHAHPLNVDSVQ